MTEKFEILWNYETPTPIFDPNLMIWRVYLTEETLERNLPDIEREIFSVGGGDLIEDPNESIKLKPFDANEVVEESEIVYSENSIAEIIKICEEEDLSFWEYVYSRETAFDHTVQSPEEFFITIWKKMEEIIERGVLESKMDEFLPDLKDEELPEWHRGVGPLNLKRKGPTLFSKSQKYLEMNDQVSYRNILLSSYGSGVVEDSAFGETVITGPTFGSSGVIPSVLYYLKHNFEFEDFSDEQIAQAIATCGLFGNIVKHNATVSGVLGGCIAEVGTASGMASAGACQLLNGTLHQIQYAAKIAREHHLDLKCEPVKGYVQIPCIERNAFGAIIALDSANYSLILGNENIETWLESYDDLVYMTYV